ncbi:Sperm acrosome membrane-associated protein 4 precursor-like [Scleropages formosus]|uniref:Sperm acrosome membrane-associated protein 4-like n=1 Tax=Scleropages formosus TaxID=113540 RepID=A0A0P7YF06_SCLFO|nr:Sperm acrosome membrane-associated protein 4 precursor-like [Scleropages formosus]
MSVTVVSMLVTLVLFTQSWALNCYKCDLGLWNMCITTTTSCKCGESCFTGFGKAAKLLDIRMKGCLKSKDCNTVSTVEFLSNATYSMMKTCCATDLCNVAPGLSQLALLSLALAMFVLVQLTGV